MGQRGCEGQDLTGSGPQSAFRPLDGSTERSTELTKAFSVGRGSPTEPFAAAVRRPCRTWCELRVNAEGSPKCVVYHGCAPIAAQAVQVAGAICDLLKLRKYCWSKRQLDLPDERNCDKIRKVLHSAPTSQPIPTVGGFPGQSAYQRASNSLHSQSGPRLH